LLVPPPVYSQFWLIGVVSAYWGPWGEKRVGANWAKTAPVEKNAARNASARRNEAVLAWKPRFRPGLRASWKVSLVGRNLKLSPRGLSSSGLSLL
jgi:hypothetical protein